jgi:hypothetical protein
MSKNVNLWFCLEGPLLPRWSLPVSLPSSAWCGSPLTGWYPVSCCWFLLERTVLSIQRRQILCPLEYLNESLRACTFSGACLLSLFVFILMEVFGLFGFQDQVSLWTSPGCPRTGWALTHRDLPASASLVLGLKACATTAWP